jgi:hypothetical protein
MPAISAASKALRPILCFEPFTFPRPLAPETSPNLFSAKGCPATPIPALHWPGLFPSDMSASILDCGSDGEPTGSWIESRVKVVNVKGEFLSLCSFQMGLTCSSGPLPINLSVLSPQPSIRGNCGRSASLFTSHAGVKNERQLDQ